MSWTTGAGGNNGGEFATSTSVSATFGGAIAVGDLLVVYAQRSYTTNDFSSDTCADTLGNVYALGGSGIEATDLQGNNWFWSIATAAGTPTVTITYPATYPNRGICVQAYRSSLGSPTLNTSSTWPSRQDLAGAGPDNLIAPAITPGGSGCKIVAGFTQYSNLNAFTAGTGFTQDQNTGVAVISYTALESLTQGVAGLITATGTDAGAAARYLGFAAAFAELTTNPAANFPTAKIRARRTSW